MLANKRIFMVEDNAGNRAVMQTVLELAGAEVAFDRWGQETTDFLCKFAPVDLVLLDMRLPRNVSGLTVYEQLRQHPTLRCVPVVIVSAHDPELSQQEMFRLGFAGFIAKPINFDLFPQQLARVLNHQPVWAY